MTKDVMEKIREHLRFIRIREYATLVICGDLSKESAVKHLRMPLEKMSISLWGIIVNKVKIQDILERLKKNKYLGR